MNYRHLVAGKAIARVPVSKSIEECGVVASTQTSAPKGLVEDDFVISIDTKVKIVKIFV